MFLLINYHNKSYFPSNTVIGEKLVDACSFVFLTMRAGKMCGDWLNILILPYFLCANDLSASKTGLEIWVLNTCFNEHWTQNIFHLQEKICSFLPTKDKEWKERGKKNPYTRKQWGINQGYWLWVGESYTHWAICSLM